MQKNTLTYGQLTEKLKTFGYTPRRAKVDGKNALIFEHEKIKNAVITLPDAPPDRIVEEPYMHMTWIILRTHGLVEEKNPLLT